MKNSILGFATMGLMALSVIAEAQSGSSCADPIIISDCQSFNTNVDVDLFPDDSGSLPVCAGIAPGASGQVWYTYTVNDPLTENMLFYGSSASVIIANVYTGACGNLQCVAMNQVEVNSSVFAVFDVSVGTYLIRISTSELSGLTFGFQTNCGSPSNCAVVPPSCVDMNSQAYAQVVTIDSFCCNTAWDSVCQDEYNAASPESMCNCAQPPLCVDMQSEAYQSVVAGDAYCCEFAWDSFCHENYQALSETCNEPGCMQSTACNYNAMAGIEDGSCQYEAHFLVYYEFNQITGLQPEFDAPVANHPVLIDATGEVLYSDSQGQITLTVASNEAVQVTLLPSGDFIPGPNTQGISVVPDCTQSALLPLSSANQALALNFWQGIAPIVAGVHCTLTNTHYMFLTNTGSTVLNGTVSIALPAGMLPTGPGWGIGPASVEGGIATWEIQDLLPGAIASLTATYAGPGTDLLGEILDFTANIDMQEGGVSVYQNSIQDLFPVICAYDPNDKQAEPEGYAEPHFIAADQELEYKIRFQNTGNFPAYDITVKDMLDITKLDIGTFAPVASSHNMTTCLQPTGEVDFIFNNIMLPDSFTNEPESHGWLVFKIRPLEDIAPGTVIHNTAGIYFDLNPPIITNTTHHTIVNCTGLADFAASANEVCEDEELQFIAGGQYVESFVWTMDDVPVGSGDGLTISPGPGAHMIQLAATHPLCAEENQMEVMVHPAPDATLSQDGAVLTATNGTSWQWFLNGTPIAGATAQSYTANEDGTHTVLVTNEYGCSKMSQGVVVTSVGEQAAAQLLLYPNPMNDAATLVLGQGVYTIDVLNAAGQPVRTYANVTGRVTLSRADYAAGTYTITVRGQGTQRMTTLVVE